METAIFAAGCFWGVESAFAELPGVGATEVGYCGGDYANPSYEDVCTGSTGHAEAVRVTFDSAKIGYATLVENSSRFTIRPNLTVNLPDIGNEYRSAIFTTSPEQKEIAEKIKDELSRKAVFRRPIATVIEPAKPFWRAEEYHQKFYAKRGGGSCHI